MGSKKHATPTRHAYISGTMASLVALVAVLLAVLFVAFKLQRAVLSYYRKYKALKPIPTHFTNTHWLLGDLRELNPYSEARAMEHLQYMQKDRSKMEKMWLGPFYYTVSLFHPSVVKKVLKEPKSHSYRLLNPWLGDGLLLSSGDKWFRNRRLLTPAFHYGILKPYVPVYNDCLKVLLQKWKNAERLNEPVKVFNTIGALSLDIILQCSFSFQSDCQSGIKKHPYVRAVCDMLLLVTERFLNPIYHVDWIYFLTPSGRKMKRYCQFVHRRSESIIRERKKALLLDKAKSIDHPVVFEKASQQRKYLDFLDILLTATDEDGNGLTDLEIRDEADTFLFEGHDTTTSGMSWTLYLLAKHPEHQEKVREEVRSVLMGREWLEYDDLKDLKYTQWCIKEAMRLYPPVTPFHRQCSEDIELDGHMLPKGTPIMISLLFLHRHPDIWENPNEFDPLRFHPSNAEGRDPYAYMPFSAGPRNCIGQNFALNEEKVVVATILSHFKLSLVEGHVVEMRLNGILRTTNDVLVNVESI